MPRGDRGELEIPRLEGEALEWVETALAIGMPYANVVQAFMDSFPEYLELIKDDDAEDDDAEDDDAEDVSDERVREILLDRFRRMRRDTRRVSYRKVKENKETLKKFLDCIPVASPLIRLVELEKMRQDPSLEPADVLKVLSAARQETDYLMPRETRSPFGGGVGIPDLPIKQSNDDNETPDQSDPADPTTDGDGFGGAMMQHANTGKETPENG